MCKYIVPTYIFFHEISVFRECVYDDVDDDLDLLFKRWRDSS